MKTKDKIWELIKAKNLESAIGIREIMHELDDCGMSVDKRNVERHCKDLEQQGKAKHKIGEYGRHLFYNPDLVLKGKTFSTYEWVHDGFKITVEVKRLAEG